MRASFSASHARTLASSLSLIFIHGVIPTREFLPEHSTSTVAPRGDRAKATCPPSSGRMGMPVELG